MKKYFVVWTLLLLALLSFTACSKDTDAASDAVINQDTLQVKDFEVSTELSASNTVAKGNVYLQKSQDTVKIIIISSITIGENDWGGVSFCIPQGWTISSALSSYPNGAGDESSNHAAIWSTADSESEWKSCVEIGRELNHTSTGGGTGTVFIELNAVNM